MPEDEIVSGSQTETTTAPERDAETEALYASFDIKPAATKKEIEFPDLSKGVIPEQTGEEGQPPATEVKPTETKTMKVKHNKEDVEVDISSDEKLTDHLQRSLALDKERERKTELEKNLDRAAKLAGFKDNADYVANLDRLEQEAKQREDNQFDQLRESLREEAWRAGLDPDSVDAWLDNHPIMKQAQTAIQERDAANQERQKTESDTVKRQKWDALYDKYPHLVDDSKVFDKGETPAFFTAEMQGRVDRGYDPIDAFELAHKDTLAAQTKKAAEQKFIKQQHLGIRSHVEGQAATEPDEVTLLPEQMALAAEFGVKLDGVRNQQKQLSRR